jgi:DNA gyrase subunit B
MSMTDMSDWPEALRRRPGMYLGDVRSPSALQHLIDELLSNVVDLHLVSEATYAKISVEPDAIVVSDDGPGLPFDVAYQNTSLASAALTSLHQSASLHGHAPHIHLHRREGFGLAILCAASERLEYSA